MSVSAVPALALCARISQIKNTSVCHLPHFMRHKHPDIIIIVPCQFSGVVSPDILLNALALCGGALLALERCTCNLTAWHQQYTRIAATQYMRA